MNLRLALGSACLPYDQLSVTATQGVAHLHARLSLFFLIQFWALVQISDSARLSTQKTLGIYWPLHTESLLLCLLPPVWCRLRPSRPSSSHVGVISGPPGPLPPSPMLVLSPALLAILPSSAALPVLFLPCQCRLWPSSPLFCNR